MAQTAAVKLHTVNLDGSCSNCHKDIRRTVKYDNNTSSVECVGPWYHVDSGKEVCNNE